MFHKIKDWFSFPKARSNKERYEQLILEESVAMFWKINWYRAKQCGFWIVKLWAVMGLIILYNINSGLAWPTLWQCYVWFIGAVGFFIFAWPSVLIFSLLTYYFRLPLLLLNPLCWVANSIYGYNFVDDLWFFRRSVIIRAQDRLLLEHGIDANLRN